MIEYVQIRDINFETIGIVDTAPSIIWHKKYFSVGDFEIYAQATSNNIQILQLGNYVTRLNDDEIGVIEKIEITRNTYDGLMIIASGRFAKSILDRRVIYNLSGKTNKATVLTGNVESAARALVVNNAIACTFNTNRNMTVLELGQHSGSTKIIVDDNGQPTQKQVTNKNLMDYTDKLLQEYGMGAKITLASNETKLQYVCFDGIDRSYDNPTGIESIIFSADLGNLIDSDFMQDTVNAKNAALIGGQGEGVERFYSTVEGIETGLARREVFIDAASISQTYIDAQEEEHSYTDAEYKKMLDSRGTLELAQLIPIESFDGTLDTTFSVWKYGIDYELGDIVTIQDNQIGIYANVRIIETTEVQDTNGYSVSINFE